MKKHLGYLRRTFLLLILAFCAVPVCTWAQNTKDFGFQPGEYRDASGKVLLYRLLKPAAQGNKRLYPLLLFLHGSWENGSDNIKQLIYIGQATTEPTVREKYPAFVLAPQCPKGQNWIVDEFTSGTRPQSAQPTEPSRLTLGLIRQLIKKYPIDPKRIYITGVSSGGFATWDLITRCPDLFAAAAPFSGGGDVKKVDRITKVPVWAFHSRMDVITNVSCTENMVNALIKAGGHPKVTLFNTPRHDCWTWTYQKPEFYQWLFAQRR